jgi:hypothetical protein
MKEDFKRMVSQIWFIKRFPILAYGFPLKKFFPFNNKKKLYEMLGEKGDVLEAKKLEGIIK